MFNVTSVKEAGAIVDALESIAEAVEGGNIVPTPTAADDGKVLTANDDGTASWEEAQGGGSDLPDYSHASAGDILAVTEDEKSGEKFIDWVYPSGRVPSTSGVTNGYVLTNDNGTPTWAAASGGGGGSVSKSTEYVYASQFSDGGDGYYYAVLSEVNLFDAYAFTASYSNGDTKHFVKIESVGLEFKSSNQVIAISSADYTAMSTASSDLIIKVLS